MWIIGKNDAQLSIDREATENEIHHRMTIADQVLPEKLPPQVAHRPVVDAETAFAMDVADHVIAAENVVRERGHQRTDIATEIRNQADLNFPSVVTASGLPQRTRLALVIGRDEEIASCTVHAQRAQQIGRQLRIEKVNMQSHLQIGAARHLAVGGSRHNDVVTPRTIRPAAANEMRERVDGRGIVAIAVLMRVDLRVKADAGTPEQTV